MQGRGFLWRVPNEFPQSIDETSSGSTHQAHSQSDRQEDIGTAHIPIPIPISIIRAKTADAGRSLSFGRAVGSGAESEGDIEIEVGPCEAHEGLGGDLSDCVVFL